MLQGMAIPPLWERRCTRTACASKLGNLPDLFFSQIKNDDALELCGE